MHNAGLFRTSIRLLFLLVPILAQDTGHAHCLGLFEVSKGIPSPDTQNGTAWRPVGRPFRVGLDPIAVYQRGSTLRLAPPSAPGLEKASLELPAVPAKVLQDSLLSEQVLVGAIVSSEGQNSLYLGKLNQSGSFQSFGTLLIPGSEILEAEFRNARDNSDSSASMERVLAIRTDGGTTFYRFNQNGELTSGRNETLPVAITLGEGSEKSFPGGAKVTRQERQVRFNLKRGKEHFNPVSIRLNFPGKVRSVDAIDLNGPHDRSSHHFALAVIADHPGHRDITGEGLYVYWINDRGEISKVETRLFPSGSNVEFITSHSANGQTRAPQRAIHLRVSSEGLPEAQFIPVQ